MFLPAFHCGCPLAGRGRAAPVPPPPKPGMLLPRQLSGCAQATVGVSRSSLTVTAATVILPVPGPGASGLHAQAEPDLESESKLDRTWNPSRTWIPTRIRDLASGLRRRLPVQASALHRSCAVSAAAEPPPR